ncbi:DUF1643 domain-containing protein [Brevibacillus daliensis]|uniref:DUF1643 domain-containing protein n=1 Tax=Brevibacillus daliensis TaxID=2892995 RepID=UPI001E2D5C5E|nr:DUF1643 domain-containing protein [Brevibacillus daliensis]
MSDMWDKIVARNICDETKLHRYNLYREWDGNKPKATIIMYNPARLNPHAFRLGSTLSKVFEHIEDKFGSIEVVNLYPMVSPKKDDIKHDRYFDEYNFTFIHDAVVKADEVILFWGNDSVTTKNEDFLNLLRDNNHKLKCFRLTKSKQPDYILSPNKVLHTLKKCYLNKNGKFEIFQ